MNRARWDRIQALFHEAVELTGAERAEWLGRACAGDEALRAEVEALLQEDARDDSLLDRGLADTAGRVLTGDGGLTHRLFGPYRLVRILGEGGMGVVYLATRADLGSEAAIKILPDAWLSPARRERFLAEQRTLAQLNHPGIARLYDADTLPDGTPWFAMEYVDGVALTAYSAGHRLSIRDRLRLFRTVCEAVQHAHQHAVIHRDLKPSNILVRSDGTVKLLDFGIAKQLESVDLPADQTRTGLRLMTPAYAAPEQLTAGPVAAHTDVYSLGVVLYELCTGRLPHDLSEATPEQVAGIIAGKEPERPSVIARRSEGPDLGTGSWGDLDVLCLTALQADPARRYRSVDALMRDVDHYLDGEPLEARPDTPGYRLGKFVRRHRQGVAVSVTVMALLLGLAGFYTIRLNAARNAAVAEAGRTQRIQRFMLSLFQGGDEAAGPAESLRVVSLLDRGVQAARLLEGDRASQADLFLTLGTVYQQLGNLDRADTLLRASLGALGSAGQSSARSQGLVALGMLKTEQAEYDEADSLLRAALAEARRRQLGGADLARASASYGALLQARGEYDSAVPYQQEAVNLLSAPKADPAQLAEALNGLANTFFYMGDYARSDSLNRVVLGMSRSLYGERHPHVADDLINLGAIQFQWGHYPEAERYDREALDIIRSWYGENHPQTASALRILARALNVQERYPEAEQLIREALAVQGRVYGPGHPEVASTLNELGILQQNTGQLDSAEVSYRRVLSIYRSTYGDRHYLVGIGLSNLANVYGRRGDYKEAERLLRDAVAHYVAALGENHDNTLIGRLKLGRILLRQGRLKEAERELLAGYEPLSRRENPPRAWLDQAEGDLQLLRDSLKRVGG